MIKKTLKPKAFHEEKVPEFMVQLSDPKELRKEVLETVREIIIFMQGYENFRKIQEEKVKLFSQLRSDIRVISSLVDNSLKKNLPKGKLKEVAAPKRVVEEEEPEEEPEVQEKVPVPQKVVPVPKSELEELEDQLNDIEGQLRGIG
ncbi:MAG: hypothetical protein AABY26_00265 [Nanoarchaeota archaeon]